MPFFRWALPVLVSLFLLSTTAWAQGATPEARAREYYQAGTSQFEAGHYLEAQASFAAGFELTNKPGFLWNMAECARLLNKPARALELYRQFLKAAPAKNPQRPDAERRVKELAPSTAPTPPTPAPPSVTTAALPPPPPLAPRAIPAAPSALLTPSPKDTPGSTPVYKRWWFWTGAGAVVTTVTVIAVVAATSGATPPSNGLPSGDHTIDWTSR